MIMVKFTDNKYFGTEACIMQRKMTRQRLPGVGKGKDLRSLPIHNPLALSQRPIKTAACKISRYVHP